jgi:hypothetical protein
VVERRGLPGHSAVELLGSIQIIETFSRTAQPSIEPSKEVNVTAPLQSQATMLKHL